MTGGGAQPIPRGLRRGPLLAAALAVVALTLGVYARVAQNGFVDYDDGSYVTKNPHVSGGLTRENVVWAFTAFHSANWHPVTWLSHQLDCQLFGLDAGAHHLVGLGLHALNAVLLLLFLASATARPWPSVLVAALFAVHPLRVESVAWAAERKDLLSGTFFFLTLLAYLGWTRRPSKARYAWVFLALALGLMAKPMLVTVPFLLLVLDFWPLGRTRATRWSRLVLEKLPLFGLAVASSVVTFLAQRAGAAIRSFEALPFAARLSNSLAAYAAYLWKTLWPVDLTFFYPHPALVARDSYSAFGPWAIFSAALLLALTVFAVLRRRTRPELLAGWLWYLGMLVPVIGLFQVGGQWMADRYAYLPLVGILAAVVFAAAELPGETTRKAAFAVGVLAVAACSAVTWRQVGYWKDSRTLFEHALAVTEDNYPALSNLGFLEFQEGHLDAAQALFERTIAVAPNLVDAHSNLGAVHYQRGEYPQAAACLERALRIAPDWVNALLNLGLVYEAQGEVDRARALYRRAVAAEPENVEARMLLGLSLFEGGELREAAGILGPAAARGDPRALAPLAWILATRADADLRDPRHALELGFQAVRSSPRSWKAHRSLAAALAASERFTEALQEVGEALALAPEEARPELMRLRELFKAGKAVSE